jgi:hypothetical protein
VGKGLALTGQGSRYLLFRDCRIITAGYGKLNLCKPLTWLRSVQITYSGILVALVSTFTREYFYLRLILVALTSATESLYDGTLGRDPQMYIRAP